MRIADGHTRMLYVNTHNHKIIIVQAVPNIFKYINRYSTDVNKFMCDFDVKIFERTNENN